jgi:hypothetical protein
LSKFNKYICIFSGLLLFGFYYLSILISFFQNGGDSFFLSTEMITDSAYLPLLLKDDVLFNDGINFFFLPFLIEKFLITFIGFNNIWISLIIYKVISFAILVFGFIKIYDLKNDNTKILFLSLLIGVLFCIDFPPFNDRYPRPAFSNIFFFYIFIANLFLISRNKISNTNLTFIGISGAILSFTNPWQGACMGLMTFYSLFKTSNLKKLFIPLISFFIVLLPIVFIFLNNSESSFHAHYLGLKKIYEPIFFMFDFYLASITSEQVMLSTVVLVIFSYILKRYYEVNVFFICFVLLPVPFTLIGYTLQSNHFLIILKSLLVLLIVNQIIYFMAQDNKNRFFNLYKKYYYYTFLIILFSMNIFFGNAWLERAEERQSRWIKYNDVFKLVDNFPNSCNLITNDNDLKIYWRNLIGGETFPKDGFVQTSPINETLNNIATSMHIMRNTGKFSIEDEKELIKYSTHNFFSSTRSWISPTFPFESSNQKDTYLNSRKNINSMQTWAIDIPTFLNKTIKRDNLENLKKIDKNYFVVLISKEDKRINFTYLDYCNE